MVRRFQSWVLRVLALFLLQDRQKMFLEIEGLLFFYRGTYTIVEEKNAWVYNKIRNFINQSSLEKDLKDLANAVIDLAERKISIDDVATKLSKFPKS